MAVQMTIYVIDACGLIAYLRGEEGGEKLRSLLKAHILGFKLQYFSVHRTPSASALICL